MHPRPITQVLDDLQELYVSKKLAKTQLKRRLDKIANTNFIATSEQFIRLIDMVKPYVSHGRKPAKEIVIAYLDILRHFGDLLTAFGKYEEAKIYLVEMVNLRSKYRNGAIAEAEDNIAYAYLNLGKVYAHLDANTAAIKKAHLIHSNIYYLKALRLLKNKDPQKCNAIAQVVADNWRWFLGLMNGSVRVFDKSKMPKLVYRIANELTATQLQKINKEPSLFRDFLSEYLCQKPLRLAGEQAINTAADNKT